MEVLWYLITTDGRYPGTRPGPAGRLPLPAGPGQVDRRPALLGALLATGAAGGDDVWVLGPR